MLKKPATEIKMKYLQLFISYVRGFYIVKTKMIINSKIFDTTHQLFPISHPWTLGVLYIPKHHFKPKILGIIVLIGGINKVLFSSFALFSFPSLFHLHWCHNHHYHQLWHVVIIERILSLLLPLDVIMNMFDVNQYLF